MPGAVRRVASATSRHRAHGVSQRAARLRRAGARRMRADACCGETFFSRLRVLFYAAAALAQHVADELDELAVETCGERLILVTGLGATETAPMAICRTWDAALVAIGVPVPGVEAKLVPARRQARGSRAKART